MKKAKRLDAPSLDEIIDELTAEAHDDDERIWNFQQALQKHIWLPCDGFVIGEPVTVVKFNYDGNQRRAVTATCRRPDGREYEVAATEVLVPADMVGSQYLVAYRQWMGWNHLCLPRGPHGIRHLTEMWRRLSICAARSS